MLRLARFAVSRKLHHFNVARFPPAYQMALRQSFSVPAGPGDHDKKDDKNPAHTTPGHGVAAPEEQPKKSAWESVKSGLSSVVDMAKDPKGTWILIKEVANHYWIGSKLLWEEIKIANEIVGRVLKGHGLTRRERMQLVRTTSDIFRLVPFAIFVIVPFMEFLLPFALKLFPNMLPSTFQDKLRKEEAMKQELQMRLSVAQFMQETIQSMASKKVASLKGGNGDVTGAKEVVSFIEKARLGEAIPNETVIRIAQLFKDELTLANVARPQLVSMCRYMGLQPYGADAILRFQLRNKFKGIKEDDRRILWEGIESLDTQELREACQERGMRSWGLTHNHLKRQLDEWLSLSIQKNIPISLLIMSRAFMLTSPDADHELGLKSSLSSLDSDTINEVVIAVAKEGEENSVDIKMRKLDSLQFQKEMIEDERDDHEDALEELSNSEKKAAAAAAAAASSASTATTSVVPTAVPSVSASSAESLASLVNQGGAAHVGPTAPDLAVPAFIANITGTPGLDVTTVSTSTADAATASSSAAAAGGVPLAAVVTATVTGPASTTTATADKPKKKQLSVAEMKALSDMARGSSVLREKAELAILQATAFNDDQEDLVSPPATEALREAAAEAQGGSSSTSGSSSGTLNTSAVKQFLSRFDTSLPKKGSSSDVDKSLIRMRAGLKSMLDDIRVKIDSTEKALGDSLNILDKDGDGQLSSEELKDAIVNILKSSSEQEAEDLIAALDSNKDGRVSLVELLSYIQQKTESSEVEALEARIIQAAEKHRLQSDLEVRSDAVSGGDRLINSNGRSSSGSSKPSA